MTTDAVPAEERLDYWRSRFCTTVVHCAIEANSEEPFWSRLEALSLGPVLAAAVSGSPKACLTAADRAAANAEGLTLDIVLQGRWLCEQAGREAIVAPGEAYLFHNRLASRQLSTTACAYRSFTVADAVVTGRLGDTERFAGLKLSADCPEIRLLLGYVEALGRAGDLSEAGVRAMVGNHLAELLVAALTRSERRENPALLQSVRAARLAAVKQLVEQRHCEPAFDLRRAARRLELSERYIQKLFEETGVTFSEHLLERRLCRARDLLLDRADAARRIQDIAWACGFSDISTFNRQFLRRFGERPSDARARSV